MPIQNNSAWSPPTSRDEHLVTIREPPTENVIDIRRLSFIATQIVLMSVITWCAIELHIGSGSETRYTTIMAFCIGAILPARRA